MAKKEAVRAALLQGNLDRVRPAPATKRAPAFSDVPMPRPAAPASAPQDAAPQQVLPSFAATGLFPGFFPDEPIVVLPNYDLSPAANEEAAEVESQDTAIDIDPLDTTETRATAPPTAVSGIVGYLDQFFAQNPGLPPVYALESVDHRFGAKLQVTLPNGTVVESSAGSATYESQQLAKDQAATRFMSEGKLQQVVQAIQPAASSESAAVQQPEREPVVERPEWTALQPSAYLPDMVHIDIACEKLLGGQKKDRPVYAVFQDEQASGPGARQPEAHCKTDRATRHLEVPLDRPDRTSSASGDRPASSKSTSGKGSGCQIGRGAAGHRTDQGQLPAAPASGAAGDMVSGREKPRFRPKLICSRARVAGLSVANSLLGNEGPDGSRTTLRLRRVYEAPMGFPSADPGFLRRRLGFTIWVFAGRRFCPLLPMKCARVRDRGSKQLLNARCTLL
jgi:hypothetical protein